MLEIQTPRLRLLQVCNVGQICGGTAACAWTVTSAFPEWQHEVLFLSAVDQRTRQHFREARIHHDVVLKQSLIDQTRPDLILLHHTAQEKIQARSSSPWIQYHHTLGQRATADLHLSCSHWVQRQIRQQSDVLHQAVTRPKVPVFRPARSLHQRLIVGRICTPTKRKWAPHIASVYQQLASRFPDIQWEFVGCPTELRLLWSQGSLKSAEFHDASWEARSRLHHWHALLYHNPDVTESFGRVCAEAMRAGCVPIVDDRGGFREQILHHQNGFLCRHTEDFTESLRQLLNIVNWSQISRRAVEHADQNFSLAAFRHRLIDQLKTL